MKCPTCKKDYHPQEGPECHKCSDAKEKANDPSDATACSSCPDAAAIPWLEGIRAMVRDRQYEVTQMMDDLDPKNCPIENEAWQRVKRELEPVADLCNRMIYRIRRGESGQTNS